MTELPDGMRSESLRDRIVELIVELQAENSQLRGSPVLSENGAAFLAELFNVRWRASFTS